MARKKFIDIRPPGHKNKEEKKLKPSKKITVFDAESKIESKKASKKENKRVNNYRLAPARLNDFVGALKINLALPNFFGGFDIRKSLSLFQRKAIFVLPLAALFGIYFLSFSFATATIEIWPKTEKVSFDVKLNLNTKIKEFNIAKSLIPAEIKEKENIVSGTFSATGKLSKTAKAGGVITVYNNYSVSYQVLVATTRFVSTEGKVFRTVEKVMIPGQTNESGKLKPGEINIRVIADESGEQYNIGPDTFSIPGFAGTDKYTKFYAKSFQAFIGGSSQEALQVTAADFNNAESDLIKRAKSETEDLLKNELQAESISSVFGFLEKATQTEIIEKSSSAKAGDVANEFNVQVKAKSKTLLFKKEDIENFVKNHILAKIPEGKKIHESSLKIDFSSESVNFASGTAQLSLKITVDIYSDMDERAIKNNVSGKSLSEIKVFLANQPEIKNVLVKMQPFWISKAPKDIDRVSIKTSFNLEPED